MLLRGLVDRDNSLGCMQVSGCPSDLNFPKFALAHLAAEMLLLHGYSSDVLKLVAGISKLLNSQNRMHQKLAQSSL